MAAQPATLVGVSDMLRLPSVGVVLGRSSAADKIVNLLYYGSKGLAEVVEEEEPEAAGALFNFSKSAAKGMSVLGMGGFINSAVNIIKRPTVVGKSAAVVSTALGLNSTMSILSGGTMSVPLPETQLCIALQTRSLACDVLSSNRQVSDIAIGVLDLTSLGAFRLSPSIESAAGCASAILWLSTEISKEHNKDKDSDK